MNDIKKGISTFLAIITTATATVTAIHLPASTSTALSTYYLIAQSQQSERLLRTLSGHSAPVWSIAISPDGQTLASGSDDKTIKLWNLKTGQLRGTLTGHSGAVNSVVISLDGQTVVSGSGDKLVD